MALLKKISMIDIFDNNWQTIDNWYYTNNWQLTNLCFVALVYNIIIVN